MFVKTKAYGSGDNQLWPVRTCPGHHVLMVPPGLRFELLSLHDFSPGLGDWRAVGSGQSFGAFCYVRKRFLRGVCGTAEHQHPQNPHSSPSLALSLSLSLSVHSTFRPCWGCDCPYFHFRARKPRGAKRCLTPPKRPHNTHQLAHAHKVNVLPAYMETEAGPKNARADFGAPSPPLSHGLKTGPEWMWR